MPSRRGSTSLKVSRCESSVVLDDETHLVAHLYGCTKLDSREIRTLLKRAAIDAQLHPRRIVVESFGPGSFTACAILAESNLTLHTYPERDLVTVHVAVCNGSSLLAYESLKKELKPREEKLVTTPLWLSEDISDGLKLIYDCKEVLVQKRTSYQQVTIATHKEFGKLLLLDGSLQLATSDEEIYHEMIVHPVMLSHPSPRRVLIIGGGDGGAAREVLKYQRVDQVQIIDIDEEAVGLYKQYLPEVNGTIWSDPRLSVSYLDGAAFLRGARDWDVVILDSTDYRSGLSSALFKEEGLDLLKCVLGDDGLGAVTLCQTGIDDQSNRLFKPIRERFLQARLYDAWIPSFAFRWGFAFLSSSRRPIGSVDAMRKLRMLKVQTRHLSGRNFPHFGLDGDGAVF